MLKRAISCEVVLMAWDLIVFISVGIALFIYLLYALLQPEKF